MIWQLVAGSSTARLAVITPDRQLKKATQDAAVVHCGGTCRASAVMCCDHHVSSQVESMLVDMVGGL
jgi:hypothetical protein